MTLGLAVGVVLYREGTITIGTVYLVLSYSLLLEGPINTMARQLQDLQRAGAGVARVGELLSTVDFIPEPTPAARTRLPRGPLAVDLDAVTFGYGDEPVLRNVSLLQAAGTSIGLVGRTGCGKSTLAKLLLRLYDVAPGDGAVRLGGVDVRHAGAGDLRARTAMVSQEVQLFHATLRDNLSLFDPGVTDQRLDEVLHTLGLGPWLEAQPEGLDTLLAPGGGGLSAGEAQLMAFARVLIGDPGLAVLDEASSRLDPATESGLRCAIEHLIAGRTVVIIAHRLSTLRRVDAIAVMDGGRILEYGQRIELEQNPASRWSRLLASGEENVELAAAVEFGGVTSHAAASEGAETNEVTG